MALALGSASAGRLVVADRVTLDGRAIRVGDVTAISGVAGSRIIARIPDGRASVTVSRRAIANLVRRAVPALRIAEIPGGSVTFTVARRFAESRYNARCVALEGPVAKGTTIYPAMVHTVPCTPSRTVAIAFDRGTSRVRATVDLPAGSYLGPLGLRPRTGLEQGETATLISAVGPVRIVRSVTAMQTSRGRRVFVRDADGQIFAVRQAGLVK